MSTPAASEPARAGPLPITAGRRPRSERVLVDAFVVDALSALVLAVPFAWGWDRPFATRDRAVNVWPLAVLSFGESWHDLHHVDPMCARHGVGRGQIDISARLIRVFEKLRRVRDVRWPTAARLARTSPMARGAGCPPTLVQGVRP